MKVKIKPKEFSEEELRFLDDFNSFFKKYPFKAFDILKLFRNDEITFKRDTTLIITLNKISTLMFNDLMEFLKFFYQDNLVSKIICQKEFLIIHFLNEYMQYVLTNNTYYMYVDYYFTLLSTTDEIYLSPLVLVNEIEQEVDLVIGVGENYFIFKKEKVILPYETYYIDLFVNYNEFRNRIHLKYYLAEKMKNIEFRKIVEQYNSLK